MPNAKLDPAALLRVAADGAKSFDAILTAAERAALRNKPDDRGSSIVYSAAEREEALSDFDTLAAMDALETLADDISTIVDRRMEAAHQKALEIYYVTEELSRDPDHPEHAVLIEHVEKMRNAHWEQFGRPIPPKRRA